MIFKVQNYGTQTEFLGRQRRLHVRYFDGTFNYAHTRGLVAGTGRRDLSLSVYW